MSKGRILSDVERERGDKHILSSKTKLILATITTSRAFPLSTVLPVTSHLLHLVCSSVLVTKSWDLLLYLAHHRCFSVEDLMHHILYH